VTASIFKVLLKEAVPSRDSRTIGIAYVYSLLKGCARPGVASPAKPIVAEAQNLFTVLNNIGTYRLNSMTSLEGITISSGIEEDGEEPIEEDREEPIEEMTWGYVEDIAGFLAAYDNQEIPTSHIKKYFRGNAPERGSKKPADGLVTRERRHDEEGDSETVTVNNGTVEKAVIEILRAKGIESGIEYIGEQIKKVGMPIVDSKRGAEDSLPMTYVGASTQQAREQALILYTLAPDMNPRAWKKPAEEPPKD
jgi:hypothetical protein